MSIKNNKIGFGCFDIDHKKTDEFVLNALKNGYRLIDTAYVYGNEEGVGIAIKKSNLDRKDIVVTSKLWNSFHGINRTKKGFIKSLNKLGLEYIDIFLIHWPIPYNKKKNYKKDIIETWNILEDLKKEGFIKEIGVSNFLEEHIQIILNNCKEKPYLNQIDLHLGNVDHNLIKYLNDNDILIEAWSPISNLKLEELPNLEYYLNKYKINKYELAIAYLANKNIVPLIKSFNEKHLIENMNAINIILEENDIKKLDEFNDTYKGHDPNNIDF